MKKLDVSQRKSLGPLILCESDLEDILDAIAECKDIEFVAEDTRYDSVKEFFSVNQHRIPKGIKIVAHDPYLNIELYPTWARLWVGSSNIKALGIFAKLDKILSGSERKPRFIYQMRWLLASMASTFLVFKAPASGFFVFFEPLHLILNLFWVFWAGYVELLSYSTIVQEKNGKGFFKRNFDPLVVAIIAAVIGIALTELVHKI